MPLIAAQPCDFALDRARAALLIIDMQRDFFEPGGFGNDFKQLRHVIAPLQTLLRAARSSRMAVIHTREGHRPDLPASKLARGRPGARIGDVGPMGRILVRGEPGHAIIDKLAPLADESVIDKPGKGAFFATDLDDTLRTCGITQRLVTAVTTEVCVSTTVREANDRGFDCIVLEDCTASYTPEFHAQSLRVIAAQGGIFGWVARSSDILPSHAPPP